jgi:hypothetical protein
MALQAMGGTQAWSNITESDIEGTATAPRGELQPFHWKDSWAGKGHMERTGPDMRGNQRHSVSIEGEHTILQGAGAGHQKPTFDRVTQLLIHLPAAAISLAIRDPRYSVEPARSLPQSSTDECVQITRNREDIARSGVQAVICFDRQTSLPSRATVLLANLIHQGANLTEKIQYQEFQQSRAIKIPKLVEVINPIGYRTLYSITSIRTNSSDPAAGGNR